jgi:L-threonylcarbamoyladenylate synthase
VRVIAPTPEGIREAAKVIRDGGIVAYPTETVYGLAVNPYSPEAIERLFAAKGRDTSCPVLLIIGDMYQLTDDVAVIVPNDVAFIRSFWPGPLSLLLAKSPQIPDILTGGGPKICVRWTSHPVAQALCKEVGTAITSTSANRSGQAPARSVADLDLPDIDLALDGGTLEPGPSTTVFDPETGTILRAGAIPEEALWAAFRAGKTSG